MPNMQKNKTEMPHQPPETRNKNWNEVALGYTEEDALNEAKRCLNCKNRPCVEGCPVFVKIPDFISAAAEGDFGKAYSIIKETNSLPSVCGRVCPQETQCESKCVRIKNGESVGIGRLERFCADWAADNNYRCAITNTPPNNKRVAILGSGPASLTCAGELARHGYDITIFEALHKAGGVLTYGIPEFRLPKSIVEREINDLKKNGVKIEVNTIIGRTITVDELFDEGFCAVFIGSGAGLPLFLGIEGENSVGVYSANEYLTRVNLMKSYREDYATPVREGKSVAVVGGGNVAMDAARCAKRLGADKVYIVYRRGLEEMPARTEEIHHAEQEDIIFKLLCNPVKINADNNGSVKSMTCIKMELGEKDESGKRSFLPVEGTEFEIEVDTVIVAIGTSPNPLIKSTTPGLESDRRGCIVTSDGVSTTRKAVWAGGDIVTGAATVILAMGAGRQAAQKIHEYLSNEK